MKKLLILSLAFVFAAGVSAFRHANPETTGFVYYKDINGNWQLYQEGDECPEGNTLVCEKPDPDMPTRIVPLYKSQTEGDFLRYDQ